MNYTELFTLVFAEDDHDLRCSVSCFKGYVMISLLQLVVAGSEEVPLILLTVKNIEW